VAFDARVALRRVRAAAAPVGGLRGAGLTLARLVVWGERGTGVPHAEWPDACDVGAVFVLLGGGRAVLRLCHADADAESRPSVRAAAGAAYHAGGCAVLACEPAAARGVIAPLAGAWSDGQRSALWQLLLEAGAEQAGLDLAVPPAPALPALVGAWAAAAASVAEHSESALGNPHSQQSRMRRAARLLLAAAVAEGARAGVVPEQLQAEAAVFAAAISSGTVQEPAPSTHDFGRVVMAAGWQWLDIDGGDMERRWPPRPRPAGQHQLVDVVPLLRRLAERRGYGYRRGDPALTAAAHFYEHVISWNPYGTAIFDGVRAGSAAAEPPPRPPAQSEEHRRALDTVEACYRARRGQGPLVLAAASTLSLEQRIVQGAFWGRLVDLGIMEVLTEEQRRDTAQCALVMGSNLALKSGPLREAAAAQAAAEAGGLAAVFAHVDAAAGIAVEAAARTYAGGPGGAKAAAAALRCASAALRHDGEVRGVVDGSVATTALLVRPSFSFPSLADMVGEVAERDRHFWKLDGKRWYYVTAYDAGTAAACCFEAYSRDGGAITLRPRGMLMGMGDSAVVASLGTALIAYATRREVIGPDAAPRQLAPVGAAPGGSLTVAGYMDDMGAGAAPEMAARSFGAAEALYAAASLQIGEGPTKRIPPSAVITMLGVVLSSVDGAMHLPPDRAASYMLDACLVRHAMAAPGLRAGVGRGELAELAGRLEWWASLCVGAQQHLTALHAAAHHEHPPLLCHAVVAQLDVWRAAWRCGGLLPRRVLRADPRRPVVVGASDAGEEAVAARAGERAVWHRLGADEQGWSSTRREYLGLQHGVRALLPRVAPGTVLLLLCDNGAVCAGINRHRSRCGDSALDDVIDSVHRAAAAAGVSIVACHVPREEQGVAMCDVLADAPTAARALLLFRGMGGVELDEV